MSLRKSIRQLRPIQENFTAPVDKVQSLLTEADTGFATLMEKSIVVAYNMKQGMSEDDAIEKGGIVQSEWKKEKKLLGASGIQQGVDIAKKLSVGKFMVHTGRASANNYYNKTLGYCCYQTPHRKLTSWVKVQNIHFQ